MNTLFNDFKAMLYKRFFSVVVLAAVGAILVLIALVATLLALWANSSINSSQWLSILVIASTIILALAVVPAFVWLSRGIKRSVAEASRLNASLLENYLVINENRSAVLDYEQLKKR